MLRLLILGACLVGLSQALFKCPDNFCDSYQCKEVSNCAGGRIVTKGGVCGCCDICVQQLDEKENCAMTILLGHEPSHECKEGLTCDRDSLVCVRDPNAGPCHKELLRYHDELKAGRHLLGRPVPVCDDNGLFGPKQCVGSVCYCAKRDGSQIDGTQQHIMNSAKQNCKCARDLADYQDRRIIGKMFNCNEMGNYKNVQCLGSVCYCVDENGKKLLGKESVHITQQDQLRC